MPSEWNIRQCRVLSNVSGEEFFLPSTASKLQHADLSALKTDRGFKIIKQLPGLKKTKMVMYSITSKFNSTFGTIGKATADKITAGVVGKLKLSL